MAHSFPTRDRIPAQHVSAEGFTFVEMLVAMSLSAMFIGTAAMVLNAITQNSKNFSTIHSIELGTTTCENFYGLSKSAVSTSAAPNLGRLGFVHEMRDQFFDDANNSEGIYCLARSGLNTIRPEWLDWPYADPAVSKPALDSPEAFRNYLAAVDPTSASVFTSYRNTPPASSPNTTIFLIGPTDQADYLKVVAVYEIDFVTSTSPAGIYASVRRYKNGTLTHYYDIFYADGGEKPVIPSFVAFESRARLAKTEGDVIDRYKVGRNGPFYLIWFPDPSINPLNTPSVAVPTDPKDPRQAYGHIAGKTGFMLTAPLFPSLK